MNENQIENSMLHSMRNNKGWVGCGNKKGRRKFNQNQFLCGFMIFIKKKKKLNFKN